jgi:hypothetical protein
MALTYILQQQMEEILKCEKIVRPMRIHMKIDTLILELQYNVPYRAGSLVKTDVSRRMSASFHHPSYT